MKKLYSRKNSYLVLPALFFLILGVFAFAKLTEKPGDVKTGLGAISGDCDGNGTVNILDFQLLSNTFGKTSGQTGYDGRCDFDNSNSINILDFQVLSNNFGKTGATPTPGNAITISAIEDSYVSLQSSGSNYGSSTNAIASDYDSNLRIAYIKFNVTNAGSINSAELRLTAGLQRAIEKKIYTVSSSWNESQITYSNKPPNGNQVGYIDRLGSTVSDGEILSIPLDATKLNPDSNGNISFAVDNAGSRNTFSFYTKESSSAPPQLVINGGGSFPTYPITPTKPAGATNTPTTKPSNTPTSGPSPTVPPPPSAGSGIWISQTDIMKRPTSGSAWQAVLSDAAGSWGTADVSNQDSKHDQMVLAGALVCARTDQYCDKTVQGLKSAIGTEEGARWLAVGRNLLSYTIAADVIKNSGHLTGSNLTAVSNWLARFLTRTLRENNGTSQEIMIPFKSGSNASAQEGAGYAAVAAYTKNTAKLNYVWNRFRLYSCDRANNPEQEINIVNGFEGGWAHTTNYNEACAVNPKGATKNSRKIDGAVINDIVRGGSFQWPPIYTGYEMTGLQGYVPSALILHRAGFPAFQLKDQAVLRAVDYVCYLDKNTSTTWWETNRGKAIMHLTKAAYGSIPSGCAPAYPVGGGMTIGYTDWTHPSGI